MSGHWIKLNDTRVRVDAQTCGDPFVVCDAIRNLYDVAGKQVLIAFQDGANFYDEDGGYLITSYPGLVRHDFDIEGAALARAWFSMAYPEYRFE